MAWRLAKSLEKLRSQVNAAFPGRSRASDGAIGDQAHSARKSEHNPDKDGVVRAIDITHDPKAGFDAGLFGESLRASRDERILYIISNGRICSGTAGPQPWVWRRYSGKNPHRHHIHISVKPGSKYYDSPKEWSAVDGMPHAPVGFMSQPDDPGVECDAGEEKPGFFAKIRNWAAGSTLFGGLTYFTDWQIALVIFGFFLVVLLTGLGIALWLFGKDGVKRWVRKQVW